MNTNKQRAFLFLAFLCLVPTAVFAAVKMPPIEHKPFATHHVVLQISDANLVTQELILNVASNLITYYGTDKLDLEIVAYGPGLQLLLADNANASRIHTLAKSYDIKFDACENTLDALTRKLGHKPALNPDAQLVPAGAARIIQLVRHGYVLMRP